MNVLITLIIVYLDACGNYILLYLINEYMSVKNKNELFVNTNRHGEC